MNHLGLFAKYWQPGQVKTRLAATVGPGTACKLYRIFLFTLLDRLGKSADRRSVVFSPPENEADFVANIDGNWQFKVQASGDLGHRMATFFQDCFSESSVDQAEPSKVVVIGADCPQVTEKDIDTAFEKLNETDVVIGPSSDGGYYLLGMKSEVTNVFENVDWSTSRVLPQTIELLDRMGKRYELMDVQTDVDDADDLGTLIELLERNSTDDRNQKLLGQIQNALTVGRSQ